MKHGLATVFYRRRGATIVLVLVMLPVLFICAALANRVSWSTIRSSGVTKSSSSSPEPAGTVTTGSLSVIGWSILNSAGSTPPDTSISRLSWRY